MTYVQFPTLLLIELGQKLNSIDHKLESNQHGAVDCGGLDNESNSAENSIHHFRGEWKTSISKLTEDIGNWGGLSKAIGDMVEQFDTAAASALSPGITAAKP
jgi:hypothetical protein